MTHRDRVLLEIERIFQDWVRYVAESVLGLSEEEVAECGGQLFVAGSHRLGVRERGADIDTVCVAPNFCTR
jgi:poly(A) polymerase